MEKHRESADRRAHPRTPYGGPVIVDAQTVWSKAQGIDVSAGGMRLRSEMSFPVGTQVELYFELQHLAVETVAQVVRQEGQVLGLVFSREVTDPTHPRLSSFRPPS